MLLSKKNILCITIIILIFPFRAVPKITERSLRNYGSEIRARLIDDNPGREKKIRMCLDGILIDDTGGIRMVDKLALFMNDLKSHDMAIVKTRFFYRGGLFSLFIVLADKNDGQTYTLFLEYEYQEKRGLCVFRDAYFSIVFDERMKEIENFFRMR